MTRGGGIYVRMGPRPPHAPLRRHGSSVCQDAPAGTGAQFGPKSYIVFRREQRAKRSELSLGDRYGACGVTM